MIQTFSFALFSWLFFNLPKHDRMNLDKPSTTVFLCQPWTGHSSYSQVSYTEIRICQGDFSPIRNPSLCHKKYAGYIEMRVILQKNFHPQLRDSLWIYWNPGYGLQWAFTRLCSHPFQIMTTLPPPRLPWVTEAHAVDWVGGTGTCNSNGFDVFVRNYNWK